MNGTKTWATNGGIANVHIIVASVDPSLGSRGQASFIVPPGSRGLSQGQKFRKHGVRASHTAEVVLADVRVPGSCLVGGKDRLDRTARPGPRGRPRRGAGRAEDVRGVPARRGRDGRRRRPGCRGVRGGVLPRPRVQFGHPIGQNQGVAFHAGRHGRPPWTRPGC